MAGTIRVRGIRQSIQGGKIIGRQSAGAGPAELLDIASLGRSLVSTGSVSGPGAPQPSVPIFAANIVDFDDASYWEIADAIGVDDGNLADQVFMPNLDEGNLSGCGNTATAGFIAGDEGLI